MRILVQMCLFKSCFVAACLFSVPLASRNTRPRRDDAHERRYGSSEWMKDARPDVSKQQ